MNPFMLLIDYELMLCHTASYSSLCHHRSNLNASEWYVGSTSLRSPIYLCSPHIF